MASASTKVDVKVVVLGQAEVGKTCLLHRFLYGRYKEQCATVAAAFGAKKLQVGTRTVTLGIWDTAGSERFESISRIYYKDARAAVLCYDMTNEATFQKVRFWVSELNANEPQCTVYITGTKLDLIQEGAATRTVSRDVVEQLARDLGAADASRRVFETSAKEGMDVDRVFETIAEDFANGTLVAAPGSAHLLQQSGSAAQVGHSQRSNGNIKLEPTAPKSKLLYTLFRTLEDYNCGVTAEVKSAVLKWREMMTSSDLALERAGDDTTFELSLLSRNIVELRDAIEQHNKDRENSVARLSGLIATQQAEVEQARECLQAARAREDMLRGQLLDARETLRLRRDELEYLNSSAADIQVRPATIREPLAPGESAGALTEICLAALLLLLLCLGIVMLYQ